jgi:CheY-like chemotaxis protein
VSHTCSPIVTGGEIVGAAVLVFPDATERQQMEERRQRLLAQEQAAREEAENANRMKDEFLAMLSHELRTPLSAIAGWAHILREGGLEPAEAARAIEVIDRNAKVQGQLISDILDVSRITSGKLWRSSCGTRGRGSAPSSCPTSSSASGRPIPPRPGRTAGSASASRSCATWSRPTPGRWWRRAPVRSLEHVRVLVVDDDPDTRGMMETVLSQRGAHVTAASSAAEALACVDRETPDVLLSDIGMPGMEGYALIRELRERPGARGIPAAALTAYAHSDDRGQAIAAGYQLHVAKPVEPAELVAVVASLAGRT